MIKRKHMTFLASEAHQGYGGISVFNTCFLRALEQDDAVRAVDVFARNLTNPEQLQTGLEKVAYVKSAANSKWRYVYHVMKEGLLKTKRTDLIVCGHINLLPLAVWLKKRKRVPLILIIHGVEAWTPRHLKKQRTLLHSVDKVVSVSQYSYQRFCEWSGWVGSWFCLPNMVDMEAYQPQAPDDRVLAPLQIEKNSRILLTVARLAADERYKGIDEVIDLMPRLTAQGPCHYVVVGRGDDLDRLQKKVQAMQLQDCVHFVGYVSDEEKKNWFCLADAFVMPGSGEGFGIVYLEALACGLPCVGSRLDGSREALREGLLGAIVDNQQPDELLLGIQAALDQPKGQVPEGLLYFSWHQYAERVQKLIDSV